MTDSDHHAPRLFALAGALFGLALAALALPFLAGGLLGVLWLFVFGDDPWPASADALVVSLIVLLPLVTIVTGTIVGYRYGRSLQATDPGGALRAARRALGGAALACLLTVGAFAAIIANRDQEHADASQQQAAFDELLRQRQQIQTANIEPRTDRSGWDVNIATAGQHAGDYTVTLRLIRSQQRLWKTSEQFALATGSNELSLSIERDDVIDAYEGPVFRTGATGLEVEETIEMEFTLEPTFSDAQRDQLPAHELQNLRLGYSDLLDKTTLPLKVHFLIGGNGQRQLR